MTADHADGDESHADDDHGHGHADRPDYDPTTPEAPARDPPLRSTAPQSEFTMSQVGVGVAVALVGLVVVFGLPLAL
jgi:hypothetical protein